MQPVIAVKDVFLRRDQRTILENITWSIFPGEHWALIGLNGSGKTSLLNMISGYLWPSKGTIQVLGRKFGECDLREVRKAIGTVSSAIQELLHRGDHVLDVVITGKYAALTLYEGVDEEDGKKALRLLDDFGCAHLAGRPYAVLSHGEKQKVLIARALMAEPELLVLDEPCTGLDLYAREKLLQDIQNLSRKANPPTIIYVTHHIEEIVPAITHAMLLRDGRIVSAGPKREVLTDKNLSETFQIPVHVEWRDERPWLQVRGNAASVSR
ncbi:ABC transporter ATP-binding protein [Bacillaceae bacterium]